MQYPVFAQQLPCGYGDLKPADEQIAQQLIRQFRTVANKDASSGPVYIAVKPHFVRTNEGVTNLSMQAFNNALAICNKYFINANIQFYICGTPANTPNYINNTAMYNWDTQNFDRDAITNANNLNNAHNIYFSKSLGGVGGFSFGATQSKVNNRTFVLNGQTDDDKTLAHELGHYFNLPHTFNNSDAVNLADRELVTRNPSEVAPRLPANCDTKGDYVCDTPADPYNLVDGKLTNCSTTGAGITAVDANGDAFVPMPDNIMGYYFCETNRFTAGQYARINAALAINNVPNSNPANRYTLDCAETTQAAPSNVVASLISGAVAVGVVLTWTDNSTNETGYIVERSTDPATGFLAIGGVDQNVTTFTDRTATKGVTYYYRVKPSNSKATYSTNSQSVSMPAYCAPVYSSTCVDNRNINNFSVATTGNVVLISNSNSGCSPNAYGDFTGLTAATVTPGTPYNFTMNTGYDGGYYPEHIAIWIDANNNTDFTDAGERVYQSTGDVMNGTTQITGQFTVPLSATSGNVRLRIRSRYKGSGVVEDPCVEYGSGEGEDYLLFVKPAMAITSSVSAVCYAATTFPVSFTTNITPDQGNQYRIELSDQAGRFSSPTVIGTGTGSPVTVTIPQATTPGSGYALRVVGTAPALTSAETATFVFSGSVALSMISTSACEGQTVTLSATATEGSQAFSYTFTGPNGILAGSGNTRSVPGLSAGPQTFSVTAANSYGCRQEATSSTTVFANPVLAVSSGSSSTLTCLQPSLTLTASGASGYTFAGPGILSQNASGTAVVNAPGTYTVTGTNANGCIGTTTIDIANDPSFPTVSVTPSSATLTCSSPSVTLTAFTSETAILWSDGSTGTTLPVSASGVYSVTVTANSGCTATATAIIEADQTNPVPVLSILPSATLTCTNPLLSLTATGGTSYTLAGAGTMLPSVTGIFPVSQADTYTVLVGKPNGCTASQTIVLSADQNAPIPTLSAGVNTTIGCLQTSLTLTAGGGTSYTFTGPGLSTQHTSGTAVITRGGVFSVVVGTANGCTSLTTITIDQVAYPAAFSISSGNQCVAASVTLTASGCPANGTVYWPEGVTGNTFVTSVTGIYTATCVVGDCSKTFSGTVSEGLPVQVSSFSATSTLTCLLTSVALQASGVGLSYQISGPGGFAYAQTFGSDSDHQIIAPNVTLAGTYTLVLSRGGSCTTSQTATVGVSYQSVPMAVTSDGPIGCGKTVSQVSAPAGTGTSYSLLSGSGVEQVNTTGTFSVTAAGSYTVVASLPGGPGCQGVGQVTVGSGGLPPVASSVAVSGTLSCSQPVVRLVANAYGDSFVFTGPDGYVFSTVYRAVSQHESVGLNVTKPGTYTFVAGSGECKASYTVTVTGEACR
ncbi:GEVED domain-containing protein [Arsenicibacter rosenii]|uniref:Fibronectin type-III domain-containing protein n=1 Tax=Arsenicibacter rosenii TaxID=1750698 RepID=A0A1S2VKA8_9BACT|nr:GEVED domain-containing protein [Arsenicibacter rosenii]OIN59189.1 hypothetical protein BLX24_09345 [Arsenicibacter rosenii]